MTSRGVTRAGLALLVAVWGIAVALSGRGVAAAPDTGTDAQKDAGKKLYLKYCSQCHGEKGDGKGEIAAEQKPPLKDWTDPAALKDITDGEQFYIIKNGKGNMTGEGDRLKTEELWNMVIYVRSFAKK